MPISHSEFLQMQQRVQSNRKIATESVGVPVDREYALHEKICNYCDSQWPKWKYIHCRMDKRSTIEEGAQDFTIFIPDKQVLCIECKAKGKKPDDNQRDWAFEMKRIGHTVYCIRSFEEFLQAVETERKPPNDSAANSGVSELRHIRD